MTDSGNPFNTRTGIGLQASKDICGGELGDSSATRRLVKGRVGTRSTCIPINHQLSNGKVIAFIIRIFFFIKRYTIRRGIRPNAVGNMGLYNSCNPSDIARLSASDVFCCNYAIFDYYARLVPREVFKVCTENTTYSWIDIIAGNRTAKPTIGNRRAVRRIFPLTNQPANGINIIFIGLCTDNRGVWATAFYLCTPSALTNQPTNELAANIVFYFSACIAVFNGAAIDPIRQNAGN